MVHRQKHFNITHDKRATYTQMENDIGGNQNDGTGFPLSAKDIQVDNALEALYDSTRSGGLRPSSPNVSRWLGDIRSFFPNTVVQVMQKDALQRLNLTQMLFEKEMLQNVEADVHLVATLMTLSRVIPDKTKDTALAGSTQGG